MMGEMADEEKVFFELFKYIIRIICELISVCYLLLPILCGTVTYITKRNSFLSLYLRTFDTQNLTHRHHGNETSILFIISYLIPIKYKYLYDETN